MKMYDTPGKNGPMSNPVSIRCVDRKVMVHLLLFHIISEFPTGQVPALEMEKDGKTGFLSQSITIARALARKHSTLTFS